MFCDGCGAALQSGQAFCSKCGKQIMGSVIVAPLHPSRVQSHTHMLGILWLALSAINTIGGLILLILGGTLFPHLHEMKDVPPNVPTGFLSSLFTVLGIFVLAKSAIGFFTGWGLLQREPWARVLALVLAFVSLFNVPFGTALGVYTLWVFLPSESHREYERMAAENAA